MKRIIVAILFLSGVATAEWQKMNVATTASFRGLSVVSATVVWASGTEGTVIRTIDGGKNWSVIHVAGAEHLDFRGIKAFDEKRAVIISSGPAEKGQAKIYRTTDGGMTWTQVYEDKRAGVFFDAIAFSDHKHGIVLSDPVDGKFALFTTDDGGTHWKQLQPATLPPALANEGAFAASNSCLAVHARKVWFATGGASVARVFRSGDRGKHWSVTETPMHPVNASSGLFSLAFLDEKFGIVVGGDYGNPDASDLPDLLVTFDGGKTWMISKSNNYSGPYFSAVSIGRVPSDGRIGWVTAAGTRGSYLAAIATDKTWIRTSAENINAIAGAWAVGPKGAVLHEVVLIRDRFN
jgi:photosystem II stability/assembly factor-like uncharacterized protein